MSADDLAPNGARPFADTMPTNEGSICICSIGISRVNAWRHLEYIQYRTTWLLNIILHNADARLNYCALLASQDLKLMERNLSIFRLPRLTFVSSQAQYLTVSCKEMGWTHRCTFCFILRGNRRNLGSLRMAVHCGRVSGRGGVDQTYYSRV